MVKIKNISLNDGLISMDCYKEGNLDDYFHLVIDAESFDVVSTTLNQPSIYLSQAVAKIMSLAQQGPLPSEAVSVWC